MLIGNVIECYLLNVISYKLNVISISGSNLLNLINNILVFSKIESGQIGLEMFKKINMMQY